MSPSSVPRLSPASLRIRHTSSARKVVLGTRATHSLEKTSTTVRMRIVRPLASTSCTCFHCPPLIHSSDRWSDFTKNGTLPPFRSLALEGKLLFGIQAVDELVIHPPSLSPKEHVQPLVAPVDTNGSKLTEPAA